MMTHGSRTIDDPKSPTNPNAYFPLAIGNRWVYRSPGNEDDTVEVARKAGALVARRPWGVVQAELSSNAQSGAR